MEAMARAPSAGELESFRRDGYVVVRGLFDAGDVARMSRWIDELVARPEVPHRHMVYYEDSLLDEETRILSRIENFCAFHTELDCLFNGGWLLDYLQAFLGERPVLFKDKINFKEPGSDGYLAHQDIQGGWDVYASYYVSMLVTIDPATQENGCLELVPGLHTQGALGPNWKPLPEDDARLEYEPCPTRPGDAVVFDAFVPHRSGPNRTAEPRRALYVSYNRASEGDHRARYYRDKRKTYPPDCERDPEKEYHLRI